MRWILTCLLALWLTGCASLVGTPATVTVDKGDTLYSISKRYDIPLRDLIDANGLRPPYTLKVGQVLRLPATSYHIVSRGDTLYAISRQYDVSVDDLKKINGLTYPYTLAIGQKIMLQGSPASTAHVASSSKHSYQQTTHNSTLNKTQTKNIPKKQKSYPVAKTRKTKFMWPVQGTIVSKFGTIGKGRANDGINIKAAKGSAVKAADAGTIAYAGNELKGFGNLILVRHNDGWITAYAHNDRLLVKKGQKVRRGEKIATVGETGGVNSPQLHFEIRAGKKAVNPVNYLP